MRLQECAKSYPTVATETLGKSAAEALVARIRNEPTKDVNVVETRLIPGETV